MQIGGAWLLTGDVLAVANEETPMEILVLQRGVESGRRKTHEQNPEKIKSANSTI